jgi:hypothetical protein
MLPKAEVTAIRTRKGSKFLISLYRLGNYCFIKYSNVIFTWLTWNPTWTELLQLRQSSDRTNWNWKTKPNAIYHLSLFERDYFEHQSVYSFAHPGNLYWYNHHLSRLLLFPLTKYFFIFTQV